MKIFKYRKKCCFIKNVEYTHGLIKREGKNQFKKYLQSERNLYFKRIYFNIENSYIKKGISLIE